MLVCPFTRLPQMYEDDCKSTYTQLMHITAAISNYMHDLTSIGWLKASRQDYFPMEAHLCRDEARQESILHGCKIIWDKTLHNPHS